MDPIELTLRTSSRAKAPSRRSKARRWSVLMRPLEAIRYHKRIPALTVYLSTAKRCRFWYFSCGAVFSEVSSLMPDGSISRGLPFTQPHRYAARFGIDVTTRPSGRLPRPFGFDIQARQSGKLIARYRRAGTCREVRRASGLFEDCQLSVLKNFPR